MRLDLPSNGPVPLDTFLGDDLRGNGHRPPAASPAAQVARDPQPVQPGTTPSISPRSTESSEEAGPSSTSATPHGHGSAPRLRPNRLQWRGRLATAPELKRSRGGIDYCVVRVIQDVLDTQLRALTQAVEVVMFRERAHDFAGTFRKGDYVEVVGELHIREWQDKTGAKHAAINLHPSEEIALISRPQQIGRAHV